MSKIPEGAKELVEQWTEGLEAVTTIQPFPDTFVIVSKDERERYHATAFFTIGTRWQVSADAQAVSADEAFAAVGRRLTF